MNDLSNKHRSTTPAAIFLRVLPCGLSDETALADFLWQKIGLNVSPDMMSVKDNGRGECNAVVIVDRFAMADFVARCLESTGEKIIKVEPGTPLTITQKYRAHSKQQRAAE